MTIREEIREFMAVSENLLNGTLSIEELTDIELDLVQYYVLGIAQRFQVIAESQMSRSFH
ncbi:MAG: hypothetical protein NDI90_19805 [Nitrospira sp. BO4]|jgi:hypothetical protein|nr:hypothetical protein [Nitrospira sp. BO4]